MPMLMLLPYLAHTKNTHRFPWDDVFRSISYSAYSGGKKNVLRGVHTVYISETQRTGMKEGLSIFSTHCFTLLHWWKSQMLFVLWQQGQLSRLRWMHRWGDHTGFKSNYTSVLKACLSSQRLSLHLSPLTAGGVLFVAQEWCSNNDAYRLALQNNTKATINSLSEQSYKVVTLSFAKNKRADTERFSSLRTCIQLLTEPGLQLGKHSQSLWSSATWQRGQKAK